MIRGRRRFVRTLALALAAAPAWSLGQAPAHPARVVITYKPNEATLDRIRKTFAEHGLVDGRNLLISVVDVRGATPREAFEQQAKDVVASRPDAILMLGGDEMALFKRLTRTIPLVFINYFLDPARVGIVESLRHPGANITGTYHDWDEIQSRSWGLLKEFRPAMKRGGDLSGPWPAYAERGSHEAWKSAMRSARNRVRAQLGIEVVDIELSTSAPLEVAAAAIRKAGAEALNVYQYRTRPDFTAWLQAKKIPALGHYQFAKEGGLLAFTFRFTEGERQAIGIVARILRGESPATIPVYQSTEYLVFVNRRTARAMGLEVPASILIQASEVFD
jgi:putative tryptophan/tyrosine transport system substrate-binding protein